MRIWLITVGEPLPTDEGGARLLRTGVLARMLAAAGHDVVWWTSTFDHSLKRQRAAANRDVMFEGVRIVMLRGPGYQANISVGRLLDHRAVARQFSRLARPEQRPDVILSSLPTLELCVEAVRYADRLGVPVVIDVRDLWPDIFLDYAPAPLKGAARMMLAPMWSQARCACRGAAAITGSSPRFVEWGLELAGRAGTVLDRSFPFGYVANPPSPAQIAVAAEFWLDHGIAAEDGEFIACFFGTLAGQFDLETVIGAARLLEQRNVPIRFVICGAGERLPALKELAAGIKGVSFPGWVGAAEIWTLMRMSKVGLAPYLDNSGFSDNFPNKTIEYLSAGLPVVSSLRGYFREFLKSTECGVSYPMGSAGELAAALAGLCADEAGRRRMAANAAEVFEKQFRAENVYGDMIEFLKEVAAASSTDGPVTPEPQPAIP